MYWNTLDETKMDKMGELDITYSYIALCGTDGIALCTPRTEFFTEAGHFICIWSYRYAN